MLVPLRRPVVSRVGIYEQWPLILIDLHTEQGVVGRSYLAPTLKQSVRYIVPAIHDLAAARQGKPIAPLDDFAAGRKALGLVGLEGVSLIAVSGSTWLPGTRSPRPRRCRLRFISAARSRRSLPTTATACG